MARLLHLICREGECTMRTLGFKSLTITVALGFAILIGAASDASGQSRRDLERERQRIEKQQQKIARQIERDRRDRMRQEQSRGYRNDRAYNGGSSRSALNDVLYQGYQQGLIAGRADRSAGKYNRFNVYRNSGSAPNGDPTSADYLYRQGYLEGYEDGFYGRLRY